MKNVVCAYFRPEPLMIAKHETMLLFSNDEDEEEEVEEEDSSLPVHHPLHSQQAMLKTTRTDAKRTLQRFKTTLENLPEYRTKLEKLGPEEIDFITTAEKFSKKMTSDLKGMFKSIVSDSVLKLGAPPCSYSIVLVGDGALNQLTPFSDIEYIVLLADNSSNSMKYFYNMCYLIEMKMISIGETPLTYSRLKFFNDFFNKHITQFCDTVTPNGVKTAGLVESNCLGPFVLRSYRQLESMGTEYSIDLIQNPKDMAKFVNLLFKKKLSHLAFKMYFHCHLTGDQDLFNVFKVEMSKHFAAINLLDEDRPKLISLDVIQKMLAKTTNDPGVDLILNDNLQLPNLIRELDMLNIFINSCKLIFTLQVHSMRELLDKLKSMHLSEDNVLYLRYGWCLSYVLKCSAVAQSQSQIIGKNMLVYTVTGKNPIVADLGKNIFGCEVDSALARFYSVYTPLYKTFVTFLKSKEPPALNTCTFWDNSAITRCQGIYRLNRHLESIEGMRSYIANMKTSKVNHHEKWKFYTRIGRIALQGNLEKLAKACFMRAMDIKENIEDPERKLFAFVYTWHNLGLTHLSEDKFDKANDFFLEAIDILHKSTLNVFKTKEGNSFLCKVHESLFQVKYSMGKFLEMVGHLKLAMQYLEDSDIQNKIMIRRNLLFKIATCQLLLTQHKDCLSTLKKVYDLDMLIDGIHYPSLRIASAFRLLSQLMASKGKLRPAHQYGVAAFLLITHIVDDRNQWLTTPGQHCYDAAVSIIPAIREYALSASDTNNHHTAIHAYSFIRGASPFLRKQGDQKTFSFAIALDHYHIGEIQLKGSQNRDAYNSFQKCLEILMKVFVKKHSLHIVKTHCKIGISLNALNKSENALDSFMVALMQAQACLPADNKPHEIIADIYEMMAESNNSLKRFQKATTYFEDSISLRKELYGETHPVIAESMKKQGLIYYTINQPERAIQYLEKAVKMMRVLQGHTSKSPEIAHLHYVMGLVYKKFREFDKSEACLTTSLQTYLELYGQDSIDEVINVQQALGDMHTDNNDVYKALVFHKQCLEGMRKAYGTDDIRVARLVATIAHHYHVAQLYSDAAKVYENAINILLKLKGKAVEGTELPDWYISQAKSYEMIGDNEKASECHKKALERSGSDGQGVAAQDLIMSLKKLAETAERKGLYYQAIQLLKQSYDKSMELHSGKPSPDAATSLDSIAANYLNLKEYDDALDYNNDLQKMMRSLHGEDSIHPQIANAHLRAGNIHQAGGRTVLAIEEFRKAMLMYRSINKTTPDNMQLALSLSKLGHSLDLAGEGTEAVSHLKECISMLERLEVHTSNKRDLYCESLYHLGLALEIHPNFPEALIIHEKAFDAWRDYLTMGDDKKTMKRIPKHLAIADCYHALGRTYTTLGNFTEGIKHLHLHIDLRARLAGKRKVVIEQAHYSLELGCAYLDNGQAEEAVLEYTKALHIMKHVYKEKRPRLHIAECLWRLVAGYRAAGLLQKAADTARQALEVYEALFGEDTKYHPTAIALTYSQAEITMELGKPRMALKHYKKAVQYYMNMHGDNNSYSKDLKEAMMKMRICAEEVERLKEAKKVAAEEKALARQSKTLRT